MYCTAGHTQGTSDKHELYFTYIGSNLVLSLLKGNDCRSIECHFGALQCTVIGL